MVWSSTQSQLTQQKGGSHFFVLLAHILAVCIAQYRTRVPGLRLVK